MEPAQPLASQPLACIDVGSNTTRLLVAEVEGDRLRELMSQRAFTRIGKSMRGRKRIPADKVTEVADVAATQTRLAREVGAARVVGVATAAIRQAANASELVDAVARASGVELRVLTGDEEARYAFLGATRTLGTALGGTVAVLDVGGGSSEIAVGSFSGGVTWSASLAIGSGLLADGYLRSDPPTVAELHALRQHASGAFEGLVVPPVDAALAVGGSATSLRRLTGALLEHETLERALRVLATTPIAEVSAQFALDPERVRLLPAGVVLLDELSVLVGRPVQIGKGGLREGVLLELAQPEERGQAAI